MKYAVIDSECTGLFNYALPAEADGQPRLASLAIITLDESLKVIEERNFFVKPDGWTMPKEAQTINGLSTEFLTQNGIPVMEVLGHYTKLIDEGYVIAAYNSQHDCKQMRGELRRAGIPDRFETTPNVCLMRAMTGICKLPKAKGIGYKFPKLAEACDYLKIKQDSAHSALGDAWSAVAILRWLSSKNLLPTAEIHYAKTLPLPVTTVQAVYPL